MAAKDGTLGKRSPPVGRSTLPTSLTTRLRTPKEEPESPQLQAEDIPPASVKELAVADAGESLAYERPNTVPEPVGTSVFLRPWSQYPGC